MTGKRANAKPEVLCGHCANLLGPVWVALMTGKDDEYLIDERVSFTQDELRAIVEAKQPGCTRRRKPRKRSRR